MPFMHAEIRACNVSAVKRNDKGQRVNSVLIYVLHPWVFMKRIKCSVQSNKRPWPLEGAWHVWRQKLVCEVWKATKRHTWFVKLYKTIVIAAKTVHVMLGFCENSCMKRDITPPLLTSPKFTQYKKALQARNWIVYAGLKKVWTIFLLDLKMT